MVMLLCQGCYSYLLSALGMANMQQKQGLCYARQLNSVVLHTVMRCFGQAVKGLCNMFLLEFCAKV